MSCLTNNNRKARREKISFWFGLGPSENEQNGKQEMYQSVNLHMHDYYIYLKEEPDEQWEHREHVQYIFALTEAFRHDSAAVLGVDNPVVVFQRMHDLKYSAHPANGVVDGDCADELCCQVSVKCQLHLKEMEHI